MFCQKHAAEYNQKWDYFEGLDKAEKEARAQTERSENAGYAEAQHYGWSGSGGAIKKAWREKAKTVHPDVKPGDKQAAAEFQKLQLAYEVLKSAEERREWRG